MQGHKSSHARGLDVSHYQGNVNWANVALSYEFGITKATESTNYIDPMFVNNYASMESHSMIRGTYHFARPNDSAKAQATFYVTTVNKHGGFNGIPPVLDIEVTGGLSSSGLVSWIHEFMNTVKTLTGIHPIIYTYLSFAHEHFDSSLTVYPLWIADYSSIAPPNVNGWSEWTFWQYADNGKVNGISGNVDLDEFNGSVHDLMNFCKEKGVVNTVSTPLLRVGSQGNDVKTLQSQLVRILNLKNFAVDGIFGSGTEAAVKKFQVEYHVSPVDGIVGSITEAAIKKEINALDAKAKTLAPSTPPKSNPAPPPTHEPSPPPASNPQPNGSDTPLNNVESVINAAETAMTNAKNALNDMEKKYEDTQTELSSVNDQLKQAQAELDNYKKIATQAESLAQQISDLFKGA